MATAQLYTRRFYSKVEIRRTNPYLVLATSVYLACKMEECPHHIRLVVSEGRILWPGTSADPTFALPILIALTRFLQQRHFQTRRMRVLHDI